MNKKEFKSHRSKKSKFNLQQLEPYHNIKIFILFFCEEIKYWYMYSIMKSFGMLSWKRFEFMTMIYFNIKLLLLSW